MSRVKGCIVCGVTLGKDERLLCSDCSGPGNGDGYMVNTNKDDVYPIYIKITKDGPFDITAWVEAMILDE